jgi:putative ABC transport system permease protein
MGQAVPFPYVKIVGVVGSVKRTTVQREMGWLESPTMYRPLGQHVPDSASLMVASAVGPAVAGGIRRAAAEIDPDAGIGEVEPVERRLLRVMAYPRFRAVVFGAFAGFALLLAAAGLYGVLSQMVAQRRQEIGVRMAMGAQPGDVVLMVMRQAAAPLGIGLVLGLAASVAAARWSAALLYGVSAGDPVTLAAVGAVLALSGAAASLIPARRAARTNPTETLRAE